MQLFTGYTKKNNSQSQNSSLGFIIRFRNKQDENVTGLSSSARAVRKRRNLVSVQFNFMNWLLETTSLSLLMIGDRWNVVLNLLYFLVNSCGTPLVILINCFFIFYQFFFSWSTSLALRKTGSGPKSTSGPAWIFFREIKLRWLPVVMRRQKIYEMNSIRDWLSL